MHVLLARMSSPADSLLDEEIQRIQQLPTDPHHAKSEASAPDKASETLCSGVPDAVDKPWPEGFSQFLVGWPRFGSAQLSSRASLSYLW